ncbi:hypothetical protein FisN_2Lu548 [Fistulifera solaris]|uniref:Uncharacterized protein n=1 Tax=Fistulifera solaris TaxID=1519565 RepID=A0A1Z5JAM8_FISSO|nr:hypothetical protein FisN_2Lu548 [Fistulifera solaris]|eukprot:GAX11019.1 hypothetical protein FisN_2Lu548 [Fistulifera solaris]
MAKDIHVTVVVDGDHNDNWEWDKLLILFLKKVANWGHFERLDVSVRYWHNHQRGWAHYKAKRVALVAEALIDILRESQAFLSCLDLSDLKSIVKWSSHLEIIRKAVEDHKDRPPLDASSAIILMRSILVSLITLLFFFSACLTRAWWISSHVSLYRSARSFSSASSKRSAITQLAERKRQFIPSLSKPAAKVPIVSRIVPITNEWNVTVWEWETPAPLVEDYWSSHQEQLQQQSNSQKKQLLKETTEDLLDPFGLILWPGAVVASHELLQHNHLLRNATVLVLGSGVGVEVQVAAHLGAARVYALDVHPATLQLLQYGIPSYLTHVVKPIVFDLCDRQAPLPFLQTVDLMIVADVLYNPQLAQQVARRCSEAYDQGIGVLITDSQRLVHNFVEMIRLRDNGNQCSSAPSPFAWEERRLTDFTGSGILVEEDQTYNVSARVLWMKRPKGTPIT